MKNNSPWENIPIGEKVPDAVNVVIEIPKGSNNKYEFDEKLGVIKLDRVLYTPFHFPMDYGFIPETRSEDGDHLDAFVIGSDPVPSGCVVEIRPVALIKMIDSGESDFKIVGVQTKNPRFDTIKDLKDLEVAIPHLTKETTHFLSHYKDLQGKRVEIQGWEGAAAAKTEIKKAQDLFSKEK